MTTTAPSISTSAASATPVPAIETRTGPHARARTCIVTGETADPAAMVRFVVTPQGGVVPDIEGKLPGRGIWVVARRAAVERAVAKRLFARAAKMDVAAPADLADQVDAGLRRRILTLLGLAKKAGRLAVGHAKVMDAARAAPVAALFLASDAGAEGVKNARTLAAATNAPVFMEFSAAQLGLALGRANVVHAALAAGGTRPKGRVRYRSQPDAPGQMPAHTAPADDRLSGLIMREVGRLQRFLGGA